MPTICSCGNNTAGSIVCSNCGKVTSYGLEKYGDFDGVLTQILLSNLPVKMCKEDYLHKLSKMIDTARKSRLTTFLSLNKLQSRKSKTQSGYELIHTPCGNVLFEHKVVSFDVDSLQYYLTSKNMNFCPCCGERILPLTQMSTQVTISEDKEDDVDFVDIFEDIPPQAIPSVPKSKKPRQAKYSDLATLPSDIDSFLRNVSQGVD